MRRTFLLSASRFFLEGHRAEISQWPSRAKTSAKAAVLRIILRRRDRNALRFVEGRAVARNALCNTPSGKGRRARLTSVLRSSEASLDTERRWAGWRPGFPAPILNSSVSATSGQVVHGSREQHEVYHTADQPIAFMFLSHYAISS